MDFLSKEDIRKYILNERDAIGQVQKKIWDDLILEKLISSKLYINSMVIFTFVSFRSEVDTHRFISRAIKDKKTVCVPKIISKQEGIRVFKISSLTDLEPGYFGVPEPKGYCAEVDSIDIDLILMPGLAFDREGGRVGYGGGFYDRFLAKLDKDVHKIAPAYHFQLLNKVPMDEWDTRVDMILTDEEVVVKGDGS